MTDIVAHDIPYVKCRDNYADGRKKYIYVVALIDVDTRRKPRRYYMNEPFEQHGRKSAEYTDKQRQKDNEIFLLDVVFPP